MHCSLLLLRGGREQHGPSGIATIMMVAMLFMITMMMTRFQLILTVDLVVVSMF